MDVKTTAQPEGRSDLTGRVEEEFDSDSQSSTPYTVKESPWSAKAGVNELNETKEGAEGGNQESEEAEESSS